MDSSIQSLDIFAGNYFDFLNHSSNGWVKCDFFSSQDMNSGRDDMEQF